MKKLNEKFYINMFTLASLWNIGIAFLGLIFYSFFMKLFFGSNAIDNIFMVDFFYRFFLIIVGIFGLGYFFISRELSLNRGIIFLGLTSKLVLFITFAFLYTKGTVTIFALLLVIGDFIWSGLFTLFLYQTKDNTKVNFIIG